MKLNLVAAFEKTRDVYELDDSYLLAKEEGIEQVSKKDRTLLSSCYDFFDANMISALIDERYLVLVHDNVGYDVIDIDKMKTIFTFSMMDDGTGFQCDLQQSFTPYHLYIPAPTDEFFHPQDIFAQEGEQRDCELTSYSIPQFEAEKIDTQGKNIIYMARAEFLNGFLCLDNALKCYFYDGSSFILKEEVVARQFSITIDEKRRRFYCISDFGVRIYDENFMEIDRMDLISDVTGKLSEDFFKGDKLSALYNPALVEKSFHKENVCQVMLYKDRYLLCHSSETLGGFHHISLFDLDTREKVMDQKIGMSLRRVSVTKAGKIVLAGIVNTYVTEVTEDDE